MSMRKTKSGEVQAHREKVLRHLERAQKDFTDKTTDEEKFQAYLKLFNDAAYGVGRCRENFEAENHHRWNEDKTTAEILYNANKVGLELMQLAMDKMISLKSSDDRPLCRVNGTKAVFLECTKLRKRAEKDFDDTIRIYHEEVLRERKPDVQRPSFWRKMEAIIATIMAQFIFIPDGLLA
ncbi:MAG TPA: hypothetical protein VFS88_08850 [Micavibrio sp.]|nr:hypothetical protein [Micavibrio sp.]